MTSDKIHDNTINNINELLSDSQYTLEGLRLWLNNKPKQSQEHFKLKIDSTPIFAGYTFILCMNGVISYEMDKIDEAQSMLRELERRCNTNIGWLTAFRTRIFGNGNNSNSNAKKPLAQLLEEQIIMADTILSSAILTFLTQDITGLMKGSWLLRKAWKIYQNTYNQLFDLFIIKFANDPNTPPVPPNYSKPIARSTSQYTWMHTSSPNNDSSNFSNYTKDNDMSTNGKILVKNINSNNSNESNEIDALLCDNPQKKIINNDKQPPQRMVSSTSSSSSTNFIQKTINTQKQHSLTTNNLLPSKSSLCLDLAIGNVVNDTTKINGIKCPPPLTCPNGFDGTYLSQLSNSSLVLNEIDAETIRRLMGAVAFGYGIFQLSASMLPINLLRIISFFGFEGNRNIGISCLMFARLSTDMRATLATLALLWFYTFGSQMFQHEDGYSTGEINAASCLLAENKLIYGRSAIFLFFTGRVERMKANSSNAVIAYETAYKYSPQKELRLLCLHEIAWCMMIQLKFTDAWQQFHELSKCSIYSKAFYLYLTAICQGAAGKFDNMSAFRDEIVEILSKTKQKDTQVSLFVEHRVKIFSDGVDNNFLLQRENPLYWKLLVYEVLFLWCALSNVSEQELNVIVEDCLVSEDNFMEPMTGLQKLVLGGALVSLKSYTKAVAAYRECIEKRDETLPNPDAHISVFARYELAMLLLQSSHDYTQDAKKLLQDALTYKNYDLENRLSVHIQKELKKLN